MLARVCAKERTGILMQNGVRYKSRLGNLRKRRKRVGDGPVAREAGGKGGAGEHKVRPYDGPLSPQTSYNSWRGMVSTSSMYIRCRISWDRLVLISVMTSSGRSRAAAS